VFETISPYLSAIDPLLTFLAVGLMVLIWTLVALHRDHRRAQFDLTDIIMENGKVSKIAVVMLGAFLMTTWMMIHMTIHKTMTEGYFTIYGGLWISPIVARILRGPAPEPVPQQVQS
jgi:hypothetical protein